MILILGGSASGKSEYAEKRITKDYGPKVYLATMEVYDRESEARVEKHRRNRAERGFRTVECARDLSKAEIRPGEAVLLECLSNLAANEMFLPDGTTRSKEETENVLIKEIFDLKERCEALYIVGNRLTLGGSGYKGLTEEWLRAFSSVQNRIAAEAEEVIVISDGIPQYLKRKEAPAWNRKK